MSFLILSLFSISNHQKYHLRMHKLSNIIFKIYAYAQGTCSKMYKTFVLSVQDLYKSTYFEGHFEPVVIGRFINARESFRISWSKHIGQSNANQSSRFEERISIISCGKKLVMRLTPQGLYCSCASIGIAIDYRWHKSSPLFIYTSTMGILVNSTQKKMLLTI